MTSPASLFLSYTVWGDPAGEKDRYRKISVKSSSKEIKLHEIIFQFLIDRHPCAIYRLGAIILVLG
jgi:hypothetical protein